MLMESLSFLQEFKILFEIFFEIFSRKKTQKFQKIREITPTATKVGYFAQFGIVGDISGSRQS